MRASPAESCHGPGARHAETTDAKDIVHPRKAGPEVGLAICGSCHGPRNPLFPLLDAAHRFRPGGRYDDSYQAFVVTDGRQRSHDFFADGRPSSSSFEYQAAAAVRLPSPGRRDLPDPPHGPARAARRGTTSSRRRAPATRPAARATRPSSPRERRTRTTGRPRRRAAPRATCRRSCGACSTRSPTTRSTCPFRRTRPATASPTPATSATATALPSAWRRRSRSGGPARRRARPAASGWPTRSARSRGAP